MTADLAEKLRAPHRATWDSLVTNPFVAEMADGSLPIEKFRFYLEQNLHYLPEYAKVLGFGLARSNTPAEIARFARSIHQIVDVEIDTNRRLLARVIELGAADHQGAVEPSPTCLAYTSYLLAAAATGGSDDVMAAMLPFAWSYGEVAARYPARGSHPVYADWLSFFGGQDYVDYVGSLLSEFDEIIGEIDDDGEARLGRHFLAGARYERAFWNMAYTLEQWTVP